MKRKVKLFSLLLAICMFLSLSACDFELHESKTDQEKIAEIVKERFTEIDQHRYGRALSLDEAECVLLLWTWGEDITDEELEEAIECVLQSTEMIRDLISSIDDIEFD